MSETIEYFTLVRFFFFFIYFALRFVLHGISPVPPTIFCDIFLFEGKELLRCTLVVQSFIREILLNLRSSSTRIRIICRKSFLSFSSCFVSKTIPNDFDDERSCIFIGHYKHTAVQKHTILRHF